jgi:hypothetical protein
MAGFAELTFAVTYKAAFRLCILHVLFTSADKEMPRINAIGVVTVMTGVVPRWDFDVNAGKRKPSY